MRKKSMRFISLQHKIQNAPLPHFLFPAFVVYYSVFRVFAPTLKGVFYR